MGAVYCVNQQESVSVIKKGHPGGRSSKNPDPGVRILVQILPAGTFLHQYCDHSDFFHLSTIPTSLGKFYRECPPGRDLMSMSMAQHTKTHTQYWHAIAVPFQMVGRY